MQLFIAREGHARPPQTHLEAGYRLGWWVQNRRNRREIQTTEHVAQLESLPGWTWDTRQVWWDEGFATLQQFVSREGHAQSPQKCIEDGFKLGIWVANVKNRKDTLSPQRITLLESLPGWKWRIPTRI
ncbi:MAG: helicase associated domain-containing protein [Chloroflexi bacterium]|nr:helicase associated domain-containing protein [Chloroflexota bacterium]